MNNEQGKNNGIIIALLVVIIVILAVLCVLFATNTITLNTKTSENSTKETSDLQANDIEENTPMTKEEAESILNKAADIIGNVSNGYPYCGENMAYDDADAIFDEYNISTHTASKDYTSLNNMKEDLRKYMSDELISKYINDAEYIEKDQKLYCKTYHKGTILYDKENSSYEVESFTNNEIIATGTQATLSDAGDNYRENVNIEMKKSNGNYVITKYDIQ